MRTALVDIDGVLADLASRVLDEINFLTEKQFTIQDITQYSISTSLGIPKEMVFRIYNHPATVLSCPPIPGAADSLRLLRTQGTYILLATARKKALRETTKLWLGQHEFVYDGLIMNTSSQKKVSFAKDAAVAFEDNLETALLLSSAVPLVYLFDYPWNQTPDSLPPNVRRVSGWAEVR